MFQSRLFKVSNIRFQGYMYDEGGGAENTDIAQAITVHGDLA